MMSPDPSFPRIDAPKAKRDRRLREWQRCFDVFSGNSIRPCERSLVPPVQYLFSSFYAYLAKTQGSVKYPGLHSECERTLSWVRGWTSMHHLPNWHFPACLFFKVWASYRRCPLVRQASIVANLSCCCVNVLWPERSKINSVVRKKIALNIPAR